MADRPINRFQLGFVRFQCVAARKSSACNAQAPHPFSVGAHGEPRVRVPYLVASRLPRYYHFRAGIQSFQGVAAPFPSDSVLPAASRASTLATAAWDLRPRPAFPSAFADAVQ